MDIEISPAGVIRAADAVATAGEQLAAGDVAGAPGNDGFQFSAAITRFASEMQQSTALAAHNTSATAENLEVSATLLKRADDDAETVAQSLWAKVL